MFLRAHSCCGRASRSRSTPSVSLTCHFCPCLFPSYRLCPYRAATGPWDPPPGAVHVCFARRKLIASLRARSYVVRRPECRSKWRASSPSHKFFCKNSELDVLRHSVTRLLLVNLHSLLPLIGFLHRTVHSRWRQEGLEHSLES